MLRGAKTKDYKMAARSVFLFFVFFSRYFAKNVCFRWKSGVLSSDEYLACSTGGARLAKIAIFRVVCF